MPSTRYTDRFYNVLLMLIDGTVIYALLCGSLYIYHLAGATYSLRLCLELYYVPLLGIAIHAFARLYGGSVIYPGLSVNPVEELKRLTISTVGIYILLFAYMGITHTMEHYSRLALLGAMVLTLFGLPLARKIFRRVCRKYRFCMKKILIAGAGKTGRMIMEELKSNDHQNIEIAGFLDDFRTAPDILGKLSDYERIAGQYDVRCIAVCLPEEIRQHWTRRFMGTFQYTIIVPKERQIPALRIYPITVGRRFLLEIGNRLQMRFYRYEKTAAEIIFILLCLPFVLPLCAVIAVLVKASDGGPVFYRAKRLGKDGKHISVLKFRTMRQNADELLEKLLEKDPEKKKEFLERFKLKDDPRITPLGRFLRKTSLDELPQLWNVFCGEMALIGPRPIVDAEIHYYGDDYPVFSMVKPGITGLWQVSGRSDVSYAERVEMDVYYISNWSIWLDIHIFFKTIGAVLFCRGAE